MNDHAVITRFGMMRLDAEETWPPLLRDLLDRNLLLLEDYERARAERDKADDMAWLMASPNPYFEDRERVLAQCEKVMQHVDLVGCHCTRLHEGEIERIRLNGLSPLSSALLQDRIADARARGLLAPNIADRLSCKHSADETNRAGMLWFIFSAVLLKDENGVGPLLRAWGGEALYRGHMKDPKIAPVLTSVGEPCIVEAAVPAASLETFGRVGERVIRGWLARRQIATGHSPEMDGYIRDPAPADRVLRIFRHRDPDFVRLTGCDRWCQPLT